MGRIELDRAGYIAQFAAKNKAFIINELVANAFDEAGVTEVDVSISQVPGKHQVQVYVTDNAPLGFKRLADAYTMWTESLKVNNESLRGRFNEGDKKLILLAESAKIKTTKGTVRFEAEERHHSNEYTTNGSEITLIFKATKADFDD